MNLQDVTDSIEGFLGWSFAAKIEFFGWYLHKYRQKESFKAADIKECFEELHLEEPTSIPPFLNAMVKKRPKAALQKSGGFLLETRTRQMFESLYGQRAATVQVHKILSELPSRIPIATSREMKKAECRMKTCCPAGRGKLSLAKLVFRLNIRV